MELVNQFGRYSGLYNSLIIVDSSNDYNPTLANYKQVLYVRSVFKNQPYQRWLGFSKSTADILLFLDDDMEIYNEEFFNIIKPHFLNNSIAGLAINFKDKHTDTALAAIPVSILIKSNGIFKKILKYLSGYPNLPEGKLGLCGIRGKQPANGGQTEWLSGGAFAARRTCLFKNFNYQLFDLFQQKVGMGEDAIIGYGLSKQGILLYEPELLFLHNDQKDSAYSVDHFAYAKRVIYSRLYLSMEKKRLENGKYFFAKVHYQWYVLWRLSGLLFNYIIKKDTVRYNLLKGSYAGWKLAISFKFNKYGSSNYNWK